jgi:hypothetical protein
MEFAIDVQIEMAGSLTLDLISHGLSFSGYGLQVDHLTHWVRL